MLKVKRVYDERTEGDGFRTLVDRLWPRGMSKDKAHIDLWLKEIAPSDELRKWFAHDEAKRDEFRRRYFQELAGKGELVDLIKEKLKEGDVTLLYGAKNRELNQAVTLREYIEKGGKPA